MQTKSKEPSQLCQQARLNQKLVRAMRVIVTVKAPHSKKVKVRKLLLLLLLRRRPNSHKIKLRGTSGEANRATKITEFIIAAKKIVSEKLPCQDLQFKQF